MKQKVVCPFHCLLQAVPHPAPYHKIADDWFLGFGDDFSDQFSGWNRGLFQSKVSWWKLCLGEFFSLCCNVTSRVSNMVVGQYMGVEPKIGEKTQNGWWKAWKILLKWMIWRYHYFWKHPYIQFLLVPECKGPQSFENSHHERPGLNKWIPETPGRHDIRKFSLMWMMRRLTVTCRFLRIFSRAYCSSSPMAEDSFVYTRDQ